MRALWLAAIAIGCGPMLPDGRVYSTSPGLAAANVVVGGALYLAAGGCKISGCPTNTKCNRSTERCDPVKCDKTSCGPDAVCDEQGGQCIPVGPGVSAPAAPAASSATTTPAIPTPLAGPNASN